MHSSSITFDKFVEERDVDGLKSWLLAALESGDFEPFYLDLEPPSAAAQLQHAFSSLSPRPKERFKAALVRAASEWHYAGNYKPETLRELVLLAAYVRATGIVDTLRILIESEALEGLKGRASEGGAVDAYEDTMQYVVGVLQGFAPESKAVLERLFFSEDFDPRFAAQLFLGLCDCAPEEYTEYVPRFLELEERHRSQGYYSMVDVTYGFVRVVSLRTIAEKLGELDRGPQQRLLEFLCVRAWSPARLDFAYDYKGGDVTDIPRINNEVSTKDPSEPLEEYLLPIDIDLVSELLDKKYAQSGGAVASINAVLELDS